MAWGWRSTMSSPPSKAAPYTVVAVWQTPPPQESTKTPPMLTGARTNPRSRTHEPTRWLKDSTPFGITIAPFKERAAFKALCRCPTVRPSNEVRKTAMRVG